jgi:hypothetical protein
MRNVSDKVVEIIKTHNLSSFFPENRAINGKMWKNMIQPEATDDNMAHAHCILDT